MKRWCRQVQLKWRFLPKKTKNKKLSFKKIAFKDLECKIRGSFLVDVSKAAIFKNVQLNPYLGFSPEKPI